LPYGKDQQLHKTPNKENQNTQVPRQEWKTLEKNIIFNINIYKVQEKRNPQQTQTGNEKTNLTEKTKCETNKK